MPDPAFVSGFVDGADLVLLYRDEQRVMRARRRPAQWCSFHRAAEVSPEVMRELRGSASVRGIIPEGEWLRVRWADRESRRQADRWLAQAGLRSYEADVDPVQRHFADTGAKVARPRRCFLDIETDSRVTPAVARTGKARVLCWALTEQVEGAATIDAAARVVARGLLARDDDEDERRLLEELWAAADPFDQVAAWFGDIFDFPVVRARSERAGCRTKDLRRFLLIDHAAVYERMNDQAAESGDEKQSMALNEVCVAKIGRGKTEFEAARAHEFWAAGGEQRQRLLDYCTQDALLLPMLEHKTTYLALNDTVCGVAGVFPDTTSIQPTVFVDGFMLRRAAERGSHFPSRKFLTEEERAARKKFAGAWVMQPRGRGILRDVHVLDFSGMYPSILMTWNMSPETKASVPVNGPIPEGHCRAPTTLVGFRVEPTGMLCEALLGLKALRKPWSKLQAARPPGTPAWFEAWSMSTAYKVIMNSFYGVVGSPFSRYFDVEIAESVTQTGVWLIQRTIHEASLRGMEAVYSDTDSAFVRGATRAQFEEFVAWCNAELYPAMVRETGTPRNYVEVAYEKEFARLVFCGAKTYCGWYRHYKGKESTPESKPEIRGLEYRRGNSARPARRLQWEVIELLMRQQCDDADQFAPIVERYRAKILEGELELADVVQAESLSRELSGYRPHLKKDGQPAAEDAHVRVARLLKDRGEQVMEGTKIRYYVQDGTASPQRVAPAADYRGDADRFHLWEKRVWPPTQRVLAAAFPDRDWGGYDRARPRAPRRVAVRDPGPAAQCSLFVLPGRGKGEA